MKNPKQPSVFGLRLFTGPQITDRLRLSLARRLRKEELSEEAQAMVLMAIEEVVGNITESGYGGKPGQPISLWFRRLPDKRLELSLWDRADGMPSYFENPEKNDALVLYPNRPLAEMLTAKLEHRVRAGGGNVVTMLFEPEQLERCVDGHLREAA